MSNTKFPETENYVIVTGVKDVDGFDVYGIQNKQTGVIEYRDHLYPRIVVAIGDLQDRYDEILNAPQEAENVVTLSAVPNGESVQ
jgi:hypothetical protein